MWYFHIFLVWWWYIECLNWRPDWKQKTIYWVRSYGNRNATFGHHLLDFECLAPRDKKRVNVMSTFWDCICTCGFALRCHLMCFYVWFVLRVIFPYIGFSMTYTWYIALLWRFATSVALVKVWFAPKVYLCKALIPFGVKTAECHGAPNLFFKKEWESGRGT